MADIVSSEKRSQMMAGIKGKNTKPEMTIRRALHRRGFRFRLHVRNLPGKPDLVFPKYNAVIFVNGCFWHGHNCPLFKMPASRVDFWSPKIERNRHNDNEALFALNKAGWRTAVIWECSMRGTGKIELESIVDICCRWFVSDDKLLQIRGTKKQ